MTSETTMTRRRCRILSIDSNSRGISTWTSSGVKPRASKGALGLISPLGMLNQLSNRYRYAIANPMWLKANTSSVPRTRLEAPVVLHLASCRAKTRGGIYSQALLPATHLHHLEKTRARTVEMERLEGSAILYDEGRSVFYIHDDLDVSVLTLNLTRMGAGNFVVRQPNI